MPRSLSSLFACLVFSCALQAQRTWIVDAAAGPGHTHTTLAAAVQVAAPGDVIEVRAGTYAHPGTISKGLRILGQPGAEIDIGSIGFPLSIRGVRAGEELVLQGFRIRGLYTTQGFGSITDCAGRVVLRDLVTQSVLFLAEGLRIQGCKSVQLANCAVLGGLRIEDASVSILNGTFDQNRAAAPILAQDAELVLCGVKAYGFQFGGPASPALDVQRTNVRIARGAASVFAAATNASQVPALRGDAMSTLLLDPRVPLQPGPGAPAVVGFGSVQSVPLPGLEASGGAIGANVDLVLHGSNGDVWVLFVGRGELPLPTAFGPWWLAPASLLAVTAGVHGPSERHGVRIGVPAQPSLSGQVLGWQALSGPWPKLHASNPGTSVLH